MANLSNPEDRAGWEAIWRSGDIPPRFRTLAAPETPVVEWAETLPPSATILDLGCGVGRHCLYLGGRGFRMAGQDISPSGVEQTAAAYAECGILFEGRVSDMKTLPWADAIFDGALSTATIHHAPRADIQRSLAEMRRVLKPGGSFLVDFLDRSRPEYQQMRELASVGEVREIDPDTFIDERDIEDSDAFLPHHYSDEADVRDLLGAFEIVRLWTTQNPSGEEVNPRARWVAVARRPLSG
jgi:SAM-dependent methyltransferase